MFHVHKYQVPLRVTLHNDRQIFGLAHLKQSERISDMLCDARPFFPLSTRDELLLVAKSAISSVSVLKREQIDSVRDYFPGLDLSKLAHVDW